MKWLFSFQLFVILVIGVQNKESLKNETIQENQIYLSKDGNWTGPYFPADPLNKSVGLLNKTYLEKDGNWTGPYFPRDPSNQSISSLPNTTYMDKDGNWTGPYFPRDPSNQSISNLSNTTYMDKDGNWTGPYFPSESTTETVEETIKSVTYVKENGDWIGPYFPTKPQNEISNGTRQEDQKHPNRYDAQINEKYNELDDNKNEIMDGLQIDKKTFLQCDNAKDNLAVDFDPFDTSSKIHYTCLEKTYDPDPNIQPVITLLQTPTRYVSKERCMDIVLNYNDKIPIHRDHRPLGLAFGEYLYAPPQRWLNNIERGAIVMLYHPCANKQEIFELKNLLTNCLYRHIITPYTKLDKDRPLALASWTATLEMSAFDKNLVKNFIIEYAKNSPKSSFENGPYNHLLIKKSSLVSDETDSDLCPNIQ